MFLNVANYYRPLLAAIEHGIAEKFIKPRARRAYDVAETVDAAIAYVRAAAQAAQVSPPAGTPREPSALE